LHDLCGLDLCLGVVPSVYLCLGVVCRRGRVAAARSGRGQRRAALWHDKELPSENRPLHNIVSVSTKNDFFSRKSKTLCNDALHARRRRRRGCASLRENTFLFAHIIAGYKR